jgi:hypothetical protein
MNIQGPVAVAGGVGEADLNPVGELFDQLIADCGVEGPASGVTRDLVAAGSGPPWQRSQRDHRYRHEEMELLFAAAPSIKRTH